MNKCVALGCLKNSDKTIKGFQACFSGKKQGMIEISYHMCNHHYEVGGTVDKKKLIDANPHIKAFL